MRVIAVEQLKGGVGKTTTSVNLAYNLASLGYRVLLVDNDKQGNTSSFYSAFDEAIKGTHNMLTDVDIEVSVLIQNTEYENLDIIPTNMMLLLADKRTLLDSVRPQQTRYKNALEEIGEEYDFCIFDNAPSLDISVINALSMANDIIIPIKADEFCSMGLEVLVEQLEVIKKNINKDLENAYLFFTYCNKSKVNDEGIRDIYGKIQGISSKINYKVLSTGVRRTVQVDKSTFLHQPLQVCFPKGTATKDYMELTMEYLALELEV